MEIFSPDKYWLWTEEMRQLEQKRERESRQREEENKERRRRQQEQIRAQRDASTK